MILKINLFLENRTTPSTQRLQRGNWISLFCSISIYPYCNGLEGRSECIYISFLRLITMDEAFFPLGNYHPSIKISNCVSFVKRPSPLQPFCTDQNLATGYCNCFNHLELFSTLFCFLISSIFIKPTVWFHVYLITSFSWIILFSYFLALLFYIYI